MKPSFLGAVLAFAVAACAGPTTTPQPTTSQTVAEETTQEQFWYCSAAGPAQCILVPYDQGVAECKSECAAAGFPGASCRLVNESNNPCEI